MDIEQNLKRLDEFVECYRAKRNVHISEWHTFSNWLARIRGKAPVFDTLRNADIEFFHRMHGMLRMHLNNGELNKEAVEELVLYLNGHRSILSERDFFLVVYIAIISSMLIIQRSDWVSWGLVGLTAVFCLVAVIERWNMKLNDSIYNEIAELLKYEAKEG